ncbi:transcriptional repressor LexA [Candidatus Fermentibacterales bacterium]|nr:transcriptional repressor LexA [Candidatus Fermentibacterales bacterium]
MDTDLTQRQKQVLGFIRQYLADNGFPPTIREIQSHFGLASTKGVKDHLDRLEEKGFVRRRGRAARALELVDQDEAVVRVPLVGRVAAGAPVLAAENISAFVPVPASLAMGREVFLLTVQGESMIGAGILPGDYLLVRSQPSVEQGEIAVVLIGDEATVKRFYRTDGRIVLRSENPEFPNLAFDSSSPEIRIVGKVTAVLRSFEGGLG